MIKSIANSYAPIVKVTAVDKINILPAIAVKIGNAKAGTKYFADDRNSIVAPVMNEFDPGLGGHISKLNPRRMGSLRVKILGEQREHYAYRARAKQKRMPATCRDIACSFGGNWLHLRDLVHYEAF